MMLKWVISEVSVSLISEAHLKTTLSKVLVKRMKGFSASLGLLEFRFLKSSSRRWWWCFSALRTHCSSQHQVDSFCFCWMKSRSDCTKLTQVLPLSWVENSLLALETVLPMSARERRLDFLVWWRCFRSNVNITLSFRSAFSWPISIWLSVIISEDTQNSKFRKRPNRLTCKWNQSCTDLLKVMPNPHFYFWYRWSWCNHYIIDEKLAILATFIAWVVQNFSFHWPGLQSTVKANKPIDESPFILIRTQLVHPRL